MSSASSENVLTTLKIIIFGSSGVGKTCLLQRFCYDTFSYQAATIGSDYYNKEVHSEIDDKIIKVGLWDTAGLERFQTLPQSFFRGTQGAVLVYDISTRKSFLDMLKLIHDLEAYTNNEEKPILIVLGNKNDEETKREVTTEEGASFARRNKALFLETSAKTSDGVTAAFDSLIYKIIDTPGLWKKNTEGIITCEPHGDSNTTISVCGNCFSR